MEDRSFWGAGLDPIGKPPNGPQKARAGEPDDVTGGDRPILVRESVQVELDPAKAFTLLTDGMNEWWPLNKGFSFGGERAVSIHLEPWPMAASTNIGTTATASKPEGLPSVMPQT